MIQLHFNYISITVFFSALELHRPIISNEFFKRIEESCLYLKIIGRVEPLITFCNANIWM